MSRPRYTLWLEGEHAGEVYSADPLPAAQEAANARGCLCTVTEGEAVCLEVSPERAP